MNLRRAELLVPFEQMLEQLERMIRAPHARLVLLRAVHLNHIEDEFTLRIHADAFDFDVAVELESLEAERALDGALVGRV